MNHSCKRPVMSKSWPKASNRSASQALACVERVRLWSLTKSGTKSSRIYLGQTSNLGNKDGIDVSLVTILYSIAAE